MAIRLDWFGLVRFLCPIRRACYDRTPRLPLVAGLLAGEPVAPTNPRRSWHRMCERE
jgi:hypothetical protein